YYAALLNNQPMGFYAPHVLIGDARRHGLRVLRVAINRSGITCTPSDGQILLGLTTVRGLGEELAGAIVAERVAHGPYRSLADLLRRSALPRPLAERLIAVGALADFGLSRRELLWQLGLLIPRPSAERGAPRVGRKPPSALHSRRATRKPQLSLELPTEQDMVHLTDMNDWERMVADYGLLGLSPSYHPLGLLRERLPSDVLTHAQLKATRDGQRVRTAGLVVCRQRPGTAKGFLFMLLEDETGLTNVVVRPDLYEAERSVVRGEPYVVVEGTVQLRSDTLNLLATSIAPLAQVPGLLLPRPAMQHAYPGASSDPHEQPTPEAVEPGPAPSPELEPLRLATPASHDFH
ncbi:MAG: hypothetical protein H0V51_21755, partial [Chloroflexi bacterium]|nr:hypothetical protein [Chloroflexota bacterium]